MYPQMTHNKYVGPNFKIALGNFYFVDSSPFMLYMYTEGWMNVHHDNVACSRHMKKKRVCFGLKPLDLLLKSSQGVLVRVL